METPERHLDVSAAVLARYWAEVERLLERARAAGMDLAVSAPHMQRDRIVWEHQLLDPGAPPPAGTHRQTWHVYRCS